MMTENLNGNDKYFKGGKTCNPFEKKILGLAKVNKGLM